MLWQYQCLKNGTLFYYQYGSTHLPASHIIERCPVCSSKRVCPTGRSFPDVDEYKDVNPEGAASKAVRR